MYRSRIERDLNRWIDKGLLTRAAADNCLQELDSRETSFSVGRVLVILAACLLSVALLLLVASNWEMIPRILRLVGIVLLIWIFFLAGGLAAQRGRPTLSSALLVLGSASFGGAISLVGQMYHLSGDMADAALVWFLCIAIATALFRSAALTVVTGFLAWLVFGITYGDHMHLMETRLWWMVPVMAVIVLALVYWSRAHRARHTVYLMLIAFLLAFYIDNTSVLFAIAIAVAATLAYVIASVPQSPLHALSVRAGPAPEFYLYCVAGLGLLLIHVDNDGLANIAILGIATLAFSILGLTLSGKTNGAIRYLAYAAFAAECLYLASETIGTTLGTAGLFLLSGLIVAIIAWLVIRLERRFSPNGAKQG